MEGETSEISLPSFIVTTRSRPEVCMEQKRSSLGTEILVKDVMSPGSGRMRDKASPVRACSRMSLERRGLSCEP